MGNQNPKPHLSPNKNISEIEEQDIDQSQQQLTFAELDKRKFLHQICSNTNTIFHKAKKLEFEKVENWIRMRENEDLLIPARVNKIIRIHRLNHHQMNNSINFVIIKIIGLKQFNFQDCSNMRSVFFHFHDSNAQANSEDIRQLGITVRTHLLHLRKLHLYFKSIIEMKAVRSFILSFEKYAQLTDFKLYLSYVTIEQGSKAEDFGELFSVICKSQPSLKKLTVQLHGNQILTDRALVAFGHHISTHLPKLNQLHLCFIYSEIVTDNGLTGFFENLTKNKRGLNQLTLRFQYFSSITAHKFNRFECQLLQSFLDLQKLSLSFTDCGRLTLNQDEEQIEVKNPSNLISLELDFNWAYEITSSGLKSLTRHLTKDFPLLQELTLKLAGCKNVVGWNSALATNEWSQKLIALRSLTLNLCQCQWFTDMNLESLAIDLRNGFSALESLSLDLSYHPSGFTDKSLESLGSAISSSLKNLKQLTLDFSASCKQITDKGFEMLISDLRNLKTLKSLYLSFDCCDGLTEKILSMIESIYVQNDFADANEVRFDLTECRQINIFTKQTQRLEKLLSGSKITLWI